MPQKVKRVGQWKIGDVVFKERPWLYDIRYGKDDA